MTRTGQLIILLVLTVFAADLAAAGEKEESAKAIMIVDDFEDCDVDEWQPAGGSCTALATSLNPGGGVCSMELIDDCGTTYNGWYLDFASFQADTVLVSLRSQSTSMHDTFFTVGEAVVGGFRPAIFIRAHGGGFWVVAGTGGGICGAAYTALQWYDFAFTIDWGTKTYDVSIDGTPCLSGVSFVGDASTLDRIHVYNLDASAGWYDDIIMSQEPPLPSIFDDGFETGDTTAWSSTVP
jgi:hypothetical protein